MKLGFAMQHRSLPFWEGKEGRGRVGSNNGQNPERSFATDDDSSNAVRYKKNNCKPFLAFQTSKFSISIAKSITSNFYQQKKI